MYDIQILLDPNLPGQTCSPQAVGGGGRVVGMSDDGFVPDGVAIAWDQAVFSMDAAAASESMFLGVNNMREAVGTRGTEDFFNTSAIYSDGVSIVDLPVPIGGAATDINDSGLVVGFDVSEPRGYLLDRSTGAIIRIDPPPGHVSTFPTAINAGAEVVGVFEAGSGSFVYATGRTKILADGEVADINDSGVACGTRVVTDFKPVTWDTRQATPTSDPVPLPPGFTNGNARGINNAGDVVGSAWVTYGMGSGYIHSNGVTSDLNDLISDPGWHVVDAKAINDAGQIVGQADFNGQRVGYIMTPQRGLYAWNPDIAVIVGILLGGVAVDGGGRVVVGGKPRPVGPWDGWRSLNPDKRDALIALALDEAARSITDKHTREQVRGTLIKAAHASAKALVKDKATGRKNAAPAPARAVEASFDAKRELIHAIAHRAT